MKLTAAALLVICAGAVPCAWAQGGADAPTTPPLGYYRQPALHNDTIVFVSEGDLWKVPVGGGVASRLTTHLGNELTPKVSPDGQWLAFTGQYEGPTEVYVMPLAGGKPKRLTFDAATASVAGWNGGEVLAATNRLSTLPSQQLMLIDPKTLARERVPLAQAADGSFDATGNTLYFTRLPFQGSQTKRYKGGTAQQIWKFAEGDQEAVPLTQDFAGTSALPMWHDGRVYFVSDRSGHMELWSMNESGGDAKQLTRHQDGPNLGFDVKWPDLHKGRIVYQCGADIYLYDIATGTDTKVDIRLGSDFDQERERWVEKPMEYLTSAHVNPDGSRVALTARGQVFVAPAGDGGRLVEASRRDGVRYRDARFMPDGKTILAMSDETGEVEFWQIPANGVGKPEQITSNGEVLRFEGLPSPDGKRIAHRDKNQKVWVLDIESGKDSLIETNDWEEISGMRWSPDSRWLLYISYDPNLTRRVRLYDVENAKLINATTDRFDSFSADFSPDGKWIYFLSNRNLTSTVTSPWGQLQPEPFFDNTTKVYALALTKGARSPFWPNDELQGEGEAKSDKPQVKPEPTTPKPGLPPAPGEPTRPEVDPSTTPTTTPTTPTPATQVETKPAAEKDDKKAEEGEKDDAKKDDKKDAKKDIPRVVIDEDGLTARISEVPIPAGNYSDLRVSDKRLLMLSKPREPGAKASLVALEISNKKPKPVTIAGNLTDYELSDNLKKLLLRRAESLFVIDASAGASASLDEAQVKLDQWKFRLDPREEWRQMFTEAWRLERDYFYDRKMHGVDWKAMLERYLPVVDRVRSRAELNDLISQMVGELSALHIFVRGGDMRSGDQTILPASLGAILVRDESAGGFRVETIYQADPDDPERVAPLAKPGVDVREGDVITAVNGRPTLEVADMGELLRNQAGKQVLLEVKPRESLAPAANDAVDVDGATRKVVAVPISPASESDLRYTDWQYTRQMRVEEKGNGELGYVHLRAMGNENYTEFAKGFYANFNRKGMIIDVRHNRGGNIDSWLLSRLMRRSWFYWQGRVGKPTWNMQYAFRGHVVVLCNEYTASDGEAFAEGIRRLDIGTVMGTRTWGGEIWLSASNFLVDKGIATAAEVGVYGPEGEWLIEGHGVDPDVVVDNLPHATFKGEDAQLEAAIELLKRKIAEEPVEVPPAPPHPDKSYKPATAPVTPGGR